MVPSCIDNKSLEYLMVPSSCIDNKSLEYLMVHSSCIDNKRVFNGTFFVY